MTTKMLNKIETVLKAKVKAHNRRYAKLMKEYPENKYYQPIKYTKSLALDWQVRNKVFKGCNGKAVFDPIAMVATSYSWWAFVQRINGKIVFNDYNYSITTCGHQNSVRRVMKDLGIKIDLEVSTRQSLSSFDTAVLPALYNELFDLEIAAARRNAKDRSKEIRQVQSKIKLANKLGAKIDSKTLQNIKADCLHRESERIAKDRKDRETAKRAKEIDRALIQANRVVDVSTLAK